MTSEPIYYTESQLKLTGNTADPLEAANSGIKQAFFTALDSLIPAGAPAGVKPLFFVVSTLAGTKTTFQVDLEFDGTGGVRVSEHQDQFFNIAESGTLNIIAAGLALAGLGGVPLLAVAGVGTILYNALLSDSVFEIYETIQGTVDTDIQIKDVNGQVVAGVLYKDGLTSAQTPEAVEQLLVSPSIDPRFPVAVPEQHAIEIFKGSDDEPWEVFKLYDPDIVNNIMDIFFAGNVTTFEDFGSGSSDNKPNGRLYVEKRVDGVTERWFYARTREDGQEITDFSGVTDQILLDTNFFSGGGDNSDLTVHPELVAYHELNGVFRFSSSQWRVYVGNGGDNDVLTATLLDNQMFGGGGNDTLNGGGGDDVIYGDYGNDTSENASGTNSGSDNLFGGSGSDRLFGGKGDDFLFAESGTGGLEGDKYYGGSGTLNVTIDGVDILDYSGVKFSIGLRLADRDPSTINNPNIENTTVTQLDSLFQLVGQADEIYSIEKYILTNSTDWVTVTEDVNYDIESIDAKEGRDIIDFSELTKTVTVDLYNETASNSDLSINVNELKNFGHVIGTNIVGGTVGDTFFAGENSIIYDGLQGFDVLDYGFLNLSRIEVDLKKGEIAKTGFFNSVPQIDYVESIEGFGGTNYGDIFRGSEGLVGADFHAGSQGLFQLDSLDFSDYLNGVTVNLSSSTVNDGLGGDITINGFEEVIGTSLIDNITGSSNQDWLHGGDGDDVIEGGGEGDFIFGEGGVDVLRGGSGNDVYYYRNTSEIDVIIDDSGIADQIYMGGQFKFTGDNIASRNMGNVLIQNAAEFLDGDIEVLSFADGASFLMNNLGRTELPTPNIQDVVVDGLTLSGDAGNNTLTGTADNDLFYGSAGADIIDGNGGIDTVNYQGSDAAVNVNLGAGAGTGGHAEGDVLSDIENVVGTSYDDILDGGSGDDNRIDGGAGNDIIDAKSGNNIIHGGAGDDEIDAGDGNDFIDAGDGENDINAGDGNNYILAGLDDDVITTGQGDDVIKDEGGNNDINAGEGNDWISGSGSLNGGAGSDHINGIGTLDGGSGEDFLTSESNGNVLIGGTQNDYLDGNGYDNITYVAGNGVDVINDGGSNGVILMENGSETSTTFEKAENGSLVITAGSHKVVVVDHFNGSPIEGIKFDAAGTVYAIPVDGIELIADEFSGQAVDSSGNDYYETEAGSNSTIVTSGGNDTIRIGVDSGLTNIKPFDLTTIGGLTVILDGVTLNDISAIRHIETPNSITLYNGTTSTVVLDGDLNQIGTNAIFQIDGLNFSLDDIGVTTVGSSGNDNDNPFSFTGEIEGDVAGFSVDDTIYGGFGDDKLIGGEGADSLFGEEGDDELLGGAGDDVINGGAGDDIINGGAGANTLIDGLGDDLYFVGMDDTLEVGAGVNEVRAQDTVTDLSAFKIDFSSYGFLDASNNVNENGFFRDFSGSNAVDYKLNYGGGQIILDHYIDLADAPLVILANGSSAQLGSFVIEGYGSENDDSYNELLFFTEDDFIYAGAGNDAFTLVDGNDVVFGGDGNDVLTKTILSQNSPHGTGSLEAYGEAGDDTLRGGLGDDTLDGGDGNDFITDISGGTDQMFGGDGDDTFTLGWGSGDLVDGGDGNDTVLLFSANTFAPSNYSYEIDLDEQTITSAAGTHQLLSIENAAGSENDDILTGSDANNFLYGWAGDDELFGQAGNDTYLFEGEVDGLGMSLKFGDDTIDDTDGLADAIWLQQTTNINAIVINSTGFGNDMELAVGTGGDTITIKNQFLSGSDQQIENLILADGTTYDLINYTSWYDPNTAGQGSTQSGTPTNNVFLGSSGLNDTVDYSNSTALINVNLDIGIGLGGYADGDIYNNIESVIGSAFNDIITGNGDVNSLFGGLGNDILSGGVGDDLLFGGDGDDAYIFNLGDGINTILESSGFDTIQLGVGITFGDLVFNRNGNDLDIQIASGFTITDFYSGDSNKVVEQIEFDDGSTFDLTTLLTTTPESPEAINIASTGFNSYSGQDASGEASLIYSATGAALDGNVWKKIAVPMQYDVTSDTYITFEYKSTIEGEIQGFGLDDDDDYDTGPQPFKLFGTQSGGSTFIDDYEYTGAGDWQYFSINVGAHQTGLINYLTFINDHDAQPQNGNSFYRNVVLYERDPGTINVAPQAVIDEFEGAIDTNIVGNLFEDNFHGLDFDVDNDALNAVAETIVTTNGSVTILSNGDFTYTPDAGFSGTDSFIYTLEDSNGASDTTTATLFVGTTDADETFATSGVYEHYNGGAGIDLVDYSTSATRVKLNLGAGIGWDGDANDDTYVHVENVIGTDIAGDRDFIYGSESDNHIWGLAGNDQLEGMGGADTIDGGAGSDYANYGRSAAGVTVNLKTNVHTGGDAEGDNLISIENITGSDYDDNITGSDGGNKLYAGSGNDLIYGGAGNDTLYGESGADIFIYGAIDTMGHIDTIDDFSLSDGDMLDLSDVISSYDPVTDAITDFIQITDSGNNSIVSVDTDGGADNFVHIATLNDITGLTDEAALETSGNLITV